MTTQELKRAIHNLVNKTDDPEILQGIYLLMNKLLAETEDILGYEADGTPIAAEDFIRSITEADEDIELGHGISHAEIMAKYGTFKDRN